MSGYKAAVQHCKTNPVDNQTVWSGAEATASDVEKACQAARTAFPAWARLALLSVWRL